MVLETLVYSAFSHLTRLLARESFINVYMCKLVSKFSVLLVQVVLKIRIHHFFYCQVYCLHYMTLLIFNKTAGNTFISEFISHTHSLFFGFILILSFRVLGLAE